MATTVVVFAQVQARGVTPNSNVGSQARNDLFSQKTDTAAYVADMNTFATPLWKEVLLTNAVGTTQISARIEIGPTSTVLIGGASYATPFRSTIPQREHPTMLASTDLVSPMAIGLALSGRVGRQIVHWMKDTGLSS